MSKGGSKRARREEGENTDDDVQLMSSNMGLEGMVMPEDPKQDARERRHLRQQYRELLLETEQNEQQLVNPESDELSVIVQRADNLYQSVKNTREAALDSQLVAKVSSLARQKAQALQTDLRHFQPLEFAEKLVTYLDNQLQEENEPPRNRITKEAWRSLGEAVQPFFCRATPLHLMYGTIDKEVKVRNKTRETSQAKDKESSSTNDKQTVPKEVQSASEIEKHETTTEEVEHILEKLRQLYVRTERMPIDYFEFITNPTSFGQTVENMFYTSFLAKDGYVRIFLDDDKLPVIEPTEYTDEEREEVRRQPRKQVITSITRTHWQRIIEAFEIDTPLIETRAPKADGRETDTRGKGKTTKKGKGKGNSTTEEQNDKGKS